MKPSKLTASGLYRPEFEKDSCGFGLIAQMDDKPSHWLVSTSIDALARLTHRGAVAADGKTGDGCGLLMKKPDAFLRAKAMEQGIELGKLYAVGMIFLNQDEGKAAFARKILKTEVAKEGLSIKGWRPVPVNTEACGEQALLTLPKIEQLFVGAPDAMEPAELDRLLYIARRRAEKLIEHQDEVFYVTSLSSSVISYKGLVMPEALPVFYLDLKDPSLASSICVFHQRFATNTFPQWRLAQPFRYLAHNGEINTIEGNRSWAQARSFTFETPLIPSLDDIRPWVSMEGSDSSSMDNMLEGLRAGGMDIFRIMRMLVPPAWQNMDAMDSDLRAFYEYNSMHMEAWDGPAAIVMTDGRYASCSLDRNGLRPARYVITKDRHITLASEIGVYPYKPEDVVAKGRLKPGEMLAADTLTGKLLLPKDIDEQLKNRQPYRKWLAKNTQYLSTPRKSDPLTSDPLSEELLAVYEKFFQVTFEEKDQVLKVLANAGQEAIGSMGDDKPLPVLSKQVRSLYDNFRQQFAQVTNPPIDPIREQVVMSLETCFGREKNMFTETAEHAARLVCDSPVLSESKFRQLLAMDETNYSHAVISLAYSAESSLRGAIEAVCQKAEEAARSGKVILALSDRCLKEDELVISAVLATGAIHHHLVKSGLRCNVNLVIETGTARDSHQVAVLIGYGASAVYPYLAYETLHSMMVAGEVNGQSESDLAKAYRRGINKGLYKITSKMGISTIGSYRGAQLFECVGLA
ncbi:MAG: glutamate synthase large subunit, partial [Gammaproteobacteria bacterium]